MQATLDPLLLYMHFLCSLSLKQTSTALPKLPCWVNDYQQLNSNTIIHSHPLPRVDDILNDCWKDGMGLKQVASSRE
jgi:hypothetical protein